MKKLMSLVVTAVLIGSAAPAGAQLTDEPTYTWERAEALLHFHNDAQVAPRSCAFEIQTSGGPVMDCAGLIDSFDGLSVSVRMLIPKDATGPLPTLMYLHGFGANRGEFSAGSVGGFLPGGPLSSGPYFGTDFNSESFASRGYAVIMPAARGMGGSCGPRPNHGPWDEKDWTDPPNITPQPESPHGPIDAVTGEPDPTCSSGYTHIAEPEYEIRDWQHLLGLLVDHGVSDLDRLGVSGGSYGAGQAWLLATSEPWLTPAGDRTIRLAAAVPIVGWTSLQNALVPNGRATDDPDGGRSIERPYGILKESVAGGIFLGVGDTRFNHTDSSETHSYAPGAVVFWQQGEPYDKPEGAALVEAYRDKSALFAEDYFTGLGAGTVEPVPVFAVQGWNDAYFSAVEVLQMYRKLIASDPDYPISFFLGNLGHASAPKWAGNEDVREAWIDRANAFLDAYVLIGGAGSTVQDITSMSTECEGGTSEAVTSPDWDSIHRGLLTLKAESALETQSGPPNSAEELPADPLFHIDCITQEPGSYTTDRDLDLGPVPDGDFTLLGLPKLMADYELSGVDATVIAKLWDVDEDGRRTLVTRGMYRLSLAGGDDAAGKLKFQLLGNHYRFADGHRIQLQISQTDRSYLRPDNFESSVFYNNIKLELPTTEIQDD